MKIWIKLCQVLNNFLNHEIFFLCMGLFFKQLEIYVNMIQ